MRHAKPPSSLPPPWFFFHGRSVTLAWPGLARSPPATFFTGRRACLVLLSPPVPHPLPLQWYLSGPSVQVRSFEGFHELAGF